MTPEIHLREVIDSDLEVFFENQADAEANHMAAFTAKDPSDREAFDAHWVKILSNPSVTIKTIVFEGRVVGSIGSYLRDGAPEVGYWIGRDHWGKGIATAALRAFLREFKVRPIHGGAAKDNVASIRVLEKCGFTLRGEGRGFANARGKEIVEILMVLNR